MAASGMDNIASSFIRKWLSLIHCFSDIDLFVNNTLQLLLKSISLGGKQEKHTWSGCFFTGVEGSKERTAEGEVCKGHSKRAQAELLPGCSTKRSKVGCKATGQARGRASAPFWSNATSEQRKRMVMKEVTQLEQERYYIKSLSQGQQRVWTRWEATATTAITWSDI